MTTSASSQPFRSQTPDAPTNEAAEGVHSDALGTAGTTGEAHTLLDSATGPIAFPLWYR